MGDPRDTPMDVISWRRACASADCVEVGLDADHVLVRSSQAPDGPRLRFTHQEWSVFLAGVRQGLFDLHAGAELLPDVSG